MLNGFKGVVFGAILNGFSFSVYKCYGWRGQFSFFKFETYPLCFYTAWRCILVLQQLLLLLAKDKSCSKLMLVTESWGKTLRTKSCIVFTTQVKPKRNIVENRWRRFLERQSWLSKLLSQIMKCILFSSGILLISLTKYSHPKTGINSVNNLMLIRDQLILLPDKLIFSLLARIDKLNFYSCDCS